jgi:hypothetical protein
MFGYIPCMPGSTPLDPRAPSAVLREVHAAPVSAATLVAVERLDLAALDEGEQLTALELLDRVQGYVAALKTDAILALAGPTPRDDGHDWIREDIATTLRISPGSARARIADARELNDRPATLAAIREGRLSEWHARVMLKELRVTGDETVIARVEALMLDQHTTDTPAELERATRDAVLRADVDAAEARHETARKHRNVWLSTRDGDGMATLGATLPLDQALLLRAALKDITAGITPPADDPRNADAREADEFVSTFMTGALYRLNLPLDPETAGDVTSSGAADNRPVLFTTEPDGTPVFLGQPGQPGSRRAWTGPRVRINLLMTPDSLLGLRRDPAVLVGHGAITPGLAERIAGFATELRRLIHDPETGHLLDAAPDTYQFRPALKDFLGLRSPTCDFVGCGMPASACETDHTIPFPHGPTTRANGGPLNKRHHDLRHGPRWTLRRNPDGTAHWTRTSDRQTFIVRPYDYRITRVGDEGPAPDEVAEPETQTVIDPYPDEPCPF